MKYLFYFLQIKKAINKYLGLAGIRVVCNDAKRAKKFINVLFKVLGFRIKNHFLHLAKKIQHLFDLFEDFIGQSVSPRIMPIATDFFLL